MTTNSNSRCVFIFSRSPELEGSVKGMRDARALFEVTRRRIASAVEALPGVDLVEVGGARGNGSARRLAQRGRSFGERFLNAFRDVAALGYREIVAVPSDVPGLGAAELGAAFLALAAGATPLGPSPDGGVYLVGVAGPPEPLLHGVRWLTPRVAEDLAARALATGRPATLLPILSDVDARRDLVALARDARIDPEIARLLRALLRRSVPRPVTAPLHALASARRSADPRGPPPALPA